MFLIPECESVLSFLGSYAHLKVPFTTSDHDTEQQLFTFLVSVISSIWSHFSSKLRPCFPVNHLKFSLFSSNSYPITWCQNRSNFHYPSRYHSSLSVALLLVMGNKSHLCNSHLTLFSMIAPEYKEQWERSQLYLSNIAGVKLENFNRSAGWGTTRKGVVEEEEGGESEKSLHFFMPWVREPDACSSRKTS